MEGQLRQPSRPVPYMGKLYKRVERQYFWFINRSYQKLTQKCLVKHLSCVVHTLCDTRLPWFLWLPDMRRRLSDSLQNAGPYRKVYPVADAGTKTATSSH